EDTDTTARPTISEIRAPCNKRARMSRPSSSSPKGCARLGASKRRASSCADESYGHTSGPMRAATMARITIRVPTRIMSVEPDARIKKSVCEIGKQVHRDIGDGDEENASLNERVIAKADRLDEQSPEARPCEDRFG